MKAESGDRNIWSVSDGCPIFFWLNQDGKHDILANVQGRISLLFGTYYNANDRREPRLTKLGGSDWQLW